MKTHYSLLGIEPGANQAEIDAAYAHQRERYDPERVATMDEQMREVATQRTRELERAYRVLSDPQQRQQYDISLGMEQHTNAPPPSSPDEHSVPPPSSLRHEEERTTRRGWFWPVGIAAALMVIIGVWLITMDAHSSSAPAAAPISNRGAAPDFVLPDPYGGEVRLSDYEGKVVLVNFWGSWCAPCVHEIPELQAAHEHLHDQGLIVIGINLFNQERTSQGTQQTKEEIRRFVEQQGITYPIGLDVAGDVSKAYRIYPIPTSFLIDRDGMIRYVLPREITADEISGWFSELQQGASSKHEE